MECGTSKRVTNRNGTKSSRGAREENEESRKGEGGIKRTDLAPDRQPFFEKKKTKRGKENVAGGNKRKGTKKKNTQKK